MTSSCHDTLPAILGGPAVRPMGAPAWPQSDAVITAALEECARSGNWGKYDGDNCQRLRQQLREFHAAEFVALCSSGTAGIELALRGLNITAGDEVLLAGYDFKGNFLNVLTVGATPVLVDIDPQTGQMDLQRAANAIGPQTRAVIATHLHGGIVDLSALRRLAEAHRLVIIEDACQMPGAKLGSFRAGTQGDVGVISFGGSKLLSAGRGGAVLTNRADVIPRLRRYSFRGNDAYPLSELQAAVLLPQLERLDSRRLERQRRVGELCELLADVPVLTAIHTVSTTNSPDFYKVGFRYRAEACGGLAREVFAAAMQAEGIALFPGFRGLHLIHARSRFRQADELSEATRADSEWLVLHHPVLLEGSRAIHEVVAAVRKIRAHAEHLRTANLPTGTIVGSWEGEL
jgi:perosamine synthetase